ncbi:MAG: HAD family hydrolase [Pirellulales bacterium]|nr:HAD family hydrolase [Pirellulales bacterium]
MSDALAKIIRLASRPLEPVPTGVAASTPRLTGIRAVLFDIYGTLLISGSGDIGVADPAGRGQAFAEALQAIGCPFAGDADTAVAEFREVIAAHHQRSRDAGIDFPEVDIVAVWQETIERLRERGQPVPPLAPEDISRLAVEFEVRVNPVWPMPGMAQCLAELQRMGMVLGIISNAQFFTPLIFPALLEKSLDQLGFAPELRYYSYGHGRAKPGRELYRCAEVGLAARNVEPSEVLYVGNDMRNDIWPAAGVGFRTALFAGDKRSLRLRTEEKNNQREPDAILTNLNEIPPMLS